MASMQEHFERSIRQLQQMDTPTLYAHFHEIQFQTLGPQWGTHLAEILGHRVDHRVAELFFPRSPEPPAQYTADVLNMISGLGHQDVLVLHHVLTFIEEPLEVLRKAREAGLRTLIIHESPKDGSFRYLATPETQFFRSRHTFAFERHGQAKGNPALDVLQSTQSLNGWALESCTDLDFDYVSNLDKTNLVQMELALDLIEHRLSDYPSNFEEIRREITPWSLQPDSRVVVKGCSRWLKLKLVDARPDDLQRRCS